MIHNILNLKAAVTYAPYQDLENKIMLKGFLEDPTNFHSHLRRYTFSLSTQLIFGHRCPDINDPDLKELFVVGRAYPWRESYSLTDVEFRQLGGTGRWCQCSDSRSLSRSPEASQMVGSKREVCRVAVQI